MAISKEKMRAILAQFVLVIGRPNDCDSFYWDRLTDSWTSLMSDYSEEEVLAAARPLALKLRRFPVPADFAEQIESTRSVAA